jgi:hypothetical protein
MNDDWIVPAPPPQLQDPLSQLDSYLESLKSSTDNTMHNHHDEILNVAEFLYGSNALGSSMALLDASCGITKVSTPTALCKRSLYLVKGSKDAQYYLCFSAKENAVDYCSCRSFLEKATKLSSSTHNTNGSSPSLCKHLLALKLMPYLSVECPEITTSSHEEFAKLVLDRTILAGSLYQHHPSGNPTRIS